jgi:predicted tellurium resistance membrane protein TerC
MQCVQVFGDTPLRFLFRLLAALQTMLHKISFILLMMFSGCCGSVALISASHLFHEEWHSNAILGAAAFVFISFVAFSVVIWFHKEQSELK